MSKELLVLFLILISAAFLRLVSLSQIPAGFSGDEAITGYSAYSVLKTGRDEWGDFLPATFRSFGDYKPGIYTYLSILPIAIFGLNEFAVRLPAAIIGILGVLVVYFLTKRLFRSETLSLVSCLLLAVNPWHLHFSRIAAEAGLTALFFPAGLFFYLKALEKPKFLPLAFVFWGLNLFSYLPARLFTILMILAIGIWKRPKKILMSTKLTTGVIIVFVIVLLIVSSRSGSLNRFLDISVFSLDLEPLKTAQFESPLPRNFARIFDNKVTFYFTQFFENYLSYYSPTFLFTGNRPDSSSINLPGVPLLFGIEIIFLISAVFFAFAKRGGFSVILLFWLILAPLPAALTKGGMHVHRVTTFLPLFSLISAYGAVNLLEFLRKKYRVNFTPVLVIAILVAAVYSLQNYFLHLPKRPAESSRYGYWEAIVFTESVKDNYARIIFTKYNSEPQAFVAFYTKFDLTQHQKEAQDWLRFEVEGKKYLDQLAEYSLGKYEFRDTTWDNVKNLENTLIVAAPQDIPEGVRLLKTIYDPAGKEIFKILENLPTGSQVLPLQTTPKQILSTNLEDQTQGESETETINLQVTEDELETSSENFVKVTEVIDGDTVRLETGEVVRYVGIDAPERGKCYYGQSKNRNKELVEGKKVVLEKDITERDRFRRLLRLVYLEGQFINEILIKEGFARNYPYPPDLTYSEKFAQAQNKAKSQKLGLWGAC